MISSLQKQRSPYFVVLKMSIKKSVSVDSLCQTKVEPDSEKIFTLGLIPPLVLTAGYMALVQYLGKMLEDETDALPYTDPVKRVWWLGPIFFSVFYLSFVYFGPKWMENRKEFQIKPYIFTYNLYQCVFNLWTVYAMYQEVLSNPWFQGLWGNTVQHNKQGFRIAFLVWIHYNNKYMELLDTVWMILRKKNNQVSFLHCYHHVLLIWAWFFVCRFEAGGDCYFGASVNSFIHILMYGYYTLTLLNVPCPWKKWITNCQMLQFMLVLCHSIYVVIKGNMPIELPLVQGFVMLNMLVLFGQFYAKSYGAGKKDKKEITTDEKTK